ncbi:hypothetical protein [Caballeronia terrestris]|nr:hypothetical protein [Caballeronia terrestris]
MITTRKLVDRLITLADIAAVIGLVAVFAGSVGLILTKPPVVWVDVVYDDAYYYLGVARNVVESGVSSFLPPFKTNGYQPLWLALISASAYLFGTSVTSMAAQVCTLSFLFIFFFLLISKLRYGVIFPAASCIGYLPFVMAHSMETAMLPPLFILFLSRGTWKWRGVFGALLFLTRLDALSLIIAKDIVDLVRYRKADFRKYAIIVPVIAIYAWINYSQFHSIFPVSGLAKSIGNVKGQNVAVAVFHLTAMFFAIAIAAGIAIYAAVTKRRPRFQFPDELATCFIALVMCVVYYLVNSGWPVWPWYYWPEFLLTYYLILEAVGMIRAHSSTLQTRRWYALALLVVALFALVRPALSFPLYRMNFLRLSYADRGAKYDAYGAENVRLVQYLHNKGIAPGTFFAMGDRGGSFGFFLGNEYRFLHTEGLVGSYGYYKALRADEGREYVDGLGLDYLVVDRQKYLNEGNVIGVIEPVMPLSARSGVYLLCFDKSAVRFTQEYRSQTRYLLDYKKRVACPAGMTNQFTALKNHYGAVVRYTFPVELKNRHDLMYRLLGLPYCTTRRDC